MDSLDALRIPEEKKRYIIDQLNPILEEMVAECIKKMPDDPVPFMLNWLEKRKVSEEEKLLSPKEKELILKENEDLKESIRKNQHKLQDAAKLVAFESENAKETSDTESDDSGGEALDELPEELKKPANDLRKCRQSVSAEAFGEWNKKKSFIPPIVTKSDEQKDRLRNCLLKSFLFSNLEDQDLAIVIGAMKEVPVEPQQCVIEQGESGEHLYVTESGKLDCLITTSSGSPKVVKTCEPGDVFGELALLYNCPRAATVKSQEKCVLWELDRATFTHIVKESAEKKRARYDIFLSKVSLLQSMDAYERSQLADALRSETFSDGMVIVNVGDVGTKFYIVEEGEAVATKNGEVVMMYGVGDYFGELALIRNQPRAATVAARGFTKVLSLDSRSFKRLLNVSELLKRSNRYI
jgi:cAMP-dependent protein kinase regulator